MSKGKLIEANVNADYDFDNDIYHFEINMQNKDTVTLDFSEVDLTAFLYMGNHLVYLKTLALAEQQKENNNVDKENE